MRSEILRLRIEAEQDPIPYRFICRDEKKDITLRGMMEVPTELVSTFFFFWAYCLDPKLSGYRSKLRRKGWETRIRFYEGKYWLLAHYVDDQWRDNSTSN